MHAVPFAAWQISLNIEQVEVDAHSRSVPQGSPGAARQVEPAISPLSHAAAFGGASHLLVLVLQ
jgi:hypothetical protein